MKNVLIKKNIFIDDVKFCPFHPKAKIKKYRKNSKFRKPGNHMIIELLKEWKFNEKKSLVIGDNMTTMVKNQNKIFICSRYNFKLI